MVDPTILTLAVTVVATLAVLGGGGLTLWLWYRPSCSCGTRRRDIEHNVAPRFCLPRETP